MSGDPHGGPAHEQRRAGRVSRPVSVPRRLGGPDAFYYQAVRGPSPVPVSLTERDAQGRTLRVLKLRRIVGCSKHPLKYFPGGKLTLVHGSAPQGPSFSIVGERYLVSVSQPEEILVRSPSGKILTDEDLSRAASEGRETCEGESEGTGPPPGSFSGAGETRRIVLSG